MLNLGLCATVEVFLSLSLAAEVAVLVLVCKPELEPGLRRPLMLLGWSIRRVSPEPLWTVLVLLLAARPGERTAMATAEPLLMN